MVICRGFRKLARLLRTNSLVGPARLGRGVDEDEKEMLSMARTCLATAVGLVGFAFETCRR